MSRNELQRHTQTELENARTKGQLIGWIQGAGAMLLIGDVFNFIGWIPTILVVGVVVFLLYKIFGK